MADVTLEVTVVYCGRKAEDLFSPETTHSQVTSGLRADLLVLGIPHPKAENIKRLPPNSVVFFWVTNRTNPICRNVPKLVASATTLMKEQCSISSIDVTKRPYPPPRSSHPEAQIPAAPRSPVTPTFVLPSNSPSLSSAIPIPVPIPTTASSHGSHMAQDMAAPQAHDSSSQPHQQNANIPGLDMSLSALRNLAQAVQGLSDAESSQQPKPDLSHLTGTNALSVPLRDPASHPAASLHSADLSLGDHSASISRLNRELTDLRKEIAVAKTRESAVLEELRKLNAPIILETKSEAPQPDVSDMLRHEIGLRKAAEAEAEQERGKRLTAEVRLRDVERECHHPFVVPALMQAFLEVSKITDAAML